MRLAFCLYKYFQYGGMQRDFRGIAQACLSAGFEIDVYTLEWQGEKIPEFNIKIISAKGVSNHQRYQNFVKQIAGYFSENDYAAVIGFNKLPYLSIYYAADPCYKSYLNLQRPFWYQLLQRSRRLLSFEQAVFARDKQNHIFAIADDQIREYISNYHTPKQRFTLLPPWIKPDRFYNEQSIAKRAALRQHYQVDEHQWLIVAIGSGFRTKGLDRSLLALASLPEWIRSKIHFIVIGQDKFSPYQRLVKRLGLTEQVRYLGGRSDIPDFLFAADLLLHPAYKESAGIILLEAVVAGLPVLTTETCGYAHFVTEADAGLVLNEPFSQVNLNKTLEKMLTELECQTWAKNGIQYGLQHHFNQMPALTSQYIKAYTDRYWIKQTSDLYLWQDRTQSPFAASTNIFDTIQNISGEVFREVERRKTLKFVEHNVAYFVKIHQGVGWRAIIKDWLRLRQPVLGAQTEFYALQRLATENINSLQVVAAGWQGKNIAKQRSFLVTRALEGTENLETILASWEHERPTMQQQYRLIRAVARLTRDMHQAGINHRDYYTCHILAKVVPGTSKLNFNPLDLFLLDLHRAQLRQQVPKRWLIKDLSSLLFSALNTILTYKHWLCFIQEYEQQPLRSALQHRRFFWYRVLRKADSLQCKAIRNNITIAGKPYARRVLV